jgi:hypothetical protein
LAIQTDDTGGGSPIYLIAGGANNIYFRTDNVDKWYVSSGGAFMPATNDSYDVGGPSARIKNVFSRTLRIADGINSPGTEAGYATIFVDSSDGDLKVKFGDGTIRTIVTDT